MSETIQDIKNLTFSHITADLRSVLIYAVGFALTIFFCVLFQRVKHKTKLCVILCTMLTALPLSILAGVRYGVGTDYFNYMEIIHAARGDGGYSVVVNKYLLEPGFNFFIIIVSKIFGSDSVVFFIMEYVTLFVAFYSFARLHRRLNCTFATSLYLLMFYNHSLNISRQMMAMSFILLCISFLLTRRPLSYLISLVLAFLLHYSAIIGIVFGAVYFVFGKANVRYSKYKRRNIVYLIAVLVCAFFIKDIMIFFFNLIPSISKYARYLNNAPNVTMFSFVKGFIITLPLLLVNKCIKRDTALVFLRNCVWLYFVVATGTYYFAYITRMIMYIRLVIIFAVALTLPKLCRRERRLFGAYYFGLYGLSYYHSFIINNHAETFPYRFIWKNK